MKWKKPIIVVLFALLATLLAGCASAQENYDDMVAVVFELEGGVFRNSQLPVTYYYDFGEGAERRIYDPTSSELSGKDITRADYTLEGWYTQRTVHEDGTVTYSDKWDFATRTVDDEGVTLYAHWKKNAVFAYNLCYYDEDGNVVSAGMCNVNAGSRFGEYLSIIRRAAVRVGYTVVKFVDEDGNDWDENFIHPSEIGGEEDVIVNVFVEYIEGEYELVYTADDLKENRRKNIYLMNDIDFEGGEFAGFGDYKGVFEGNGHTVSNFTLTYSNGKNDLIDDDDLGDDRGLLCISLFGRMQGATVQNVAFENVTVSISTTYSGTSKIIVAPLCVKTTNSTVSGVSFSGSFTLAKLPSSFAEENLAVVTDGPYYYRAEGDASVFENVEIEVNYTDSRP